MRILIVTQWFDPEPTFKGLPFAKELQQRGHEVEVLTGYPNYPEGRVYEGYRIRSYDRTVVDGVPVTRVPLYPSHDSSALRRIANYASFAASATVASMLRSRPDVAYVYHPPGTIALPAVALRLVRGVPFVYDVHDLWPDTLSSTGMVSSSRVLGLVGRVMSWTYALSQHVIVISEGFKTRLHSRGVPEDKLTVVPTWTYEDISAAMPRGARPDSRGEFLVVFAGTMGKAQALDTVLDAAEMLQKESVRFLLIGGGIEVDRLRASAESRRLRNVTFEARRPPSEIGEVLASADALLVHLKDDPLFAITVPGKTQAYMLAGRPILMGVEGDAARMVRDAGAGVVFAPENAKAMADAVRNLMSLPLERREAMGASGRHHYETQMSLEIGAARIAEVLERAARARHRFQRSKRTVDAVGSAAALAALALPMAALGVLVHRKLGSPVLFRQVRPGRHGRPFTMLKFRSMTQAVDDNGDLLPDAERMTSFGTFLRTTSLDELPELLNVLRGEMSLVGPRPLLTRYSEYFTTDELRRLDVRPGITGLAQVSGRNLASWDKRLAMDAQYVARLSPWLDLKILAKTVIGVFGRSGVVAVPESAMQDLDVERRAEQGRFS